MQPLPSPAKRCWIPLRNRGFRRLTTPSLPDVSRHFAGPPRGQSVDDVIHELVVGRLPPEVWEGRDAAGWDRARQTTDPSLKSRCDTVPLRGRRRHVRAAGVVTPRPRFSSSALLFRPAVRRRQAAERSRSRATQTGMWTCMRCALTGQVCIKSRTVRGRTPFQPGRPIAPAGRGSTELGAMEVLGLRLTRRKSLRPR
jgi:hypothetical protein